MSSNGGMPPPYDAVVYRDEQVVGPVRLPEENRDGFISQFQQTYRGLGISVEPMERTPQIASSTPKPGPTGDKPPIGHH